MGVISVAVIDLDADPYYRTRRIREHDLTTVGQDGRTLDRRDGRIRWKDGLTLGGGGWRQRRGRVALAQDGGRRRGREGRRGKDGVTFGGAEGPQRRGRVAL